MSKSGKNPFSEMARLARSLTKVRTTPVKAKAGDDPAADFEDWAQRLGAIADEMEQTYADDEGFQGTQDCVDMVREAAGSCTATAEGVRELLQE